MRKLKLKVSVSLDGFVSGPNGEADWVFKYLDEESTAWALDMIWQAGLHIMGSKTFHDMRSYWPTSDEVFAAPMNEVPKAVFTRKGVIEPTRDELTSRSLKDARLFQEKTTTVTSHMNSWTNPAVLDGNDLEGVINKLKQQPGKDIMAHGGGTFLQSLVQTGLIDEYLLLIYPVVLGRGLPIFSKLTKPMDFKLVETKAFPKGIMACTYLPV